MDRFPLNRPMLVLPEGFNPNCISSRRVPSVSAIIVEVNEDRTILISALPIEVGNNMAASSKSGDGQSLPVSGFPAAELQSEPPRLSRSGSCFPCRIAKQLRQFLLSLPQLWRDSGCRTTISSAATSSVLPKPCGAGWASAKGTAELLHLSFETEEKAAMDSAGASPLAEARDLAGTQNQEARRRGHKTASDNGPSQPCKVDSSDHSTDQDSAK